MIDRVARTILWRNAPSAAQPVTNGSFRSIRRPSYVFTREDDLPARRRSDTSSHRLYHHYYEDLLS